eukprot:Pompholyxophrys_sp_v1_NODE_58_length_2795_cov_7.517518.p4 type:complete len:100 gc:universal NODE_58_length_2795_cov_7.517518:334-35(-)
MWQEMWVRVQVCLRSGKGWKLCLRLGCNIIIINESQRSGRTCLKRNQQHLKHQQQQQQQWQQQQHQQHQQHQHQQHQQHQHQQHQQQQHQQHQQQQQQH